MNPGEAVVVPVACALLLLGPVATATQPDDEGGVLTGTWHTCAVTGSSRVLAGDVSAYCVDGVEVEVGPRPLLARTRARVDLDGDGAQASVLTELHGLRGRSVQVVVRPESGESSRRALTVDGMPLPSSAATSTPARARHVPPAWWCSHRSATWLEGDCAI